jgi:hypothetical protein
MWGANLVKKITIVLIAIVILLLGFVTIDSIWLSNRQAFLSYNTEPYDNSSVDELSYFDISDYYSYLEEHDYNYPQNVEITIDGVDFIDSIGEHQTFDIYEGISNVLLTAESGMVTWEVDVPSSGYYNLFLNYFPYEGKSSSVERAVYINGEIPFDGANNITFNRIWSNAYEVKADLNGNDIRPSQIEKPFWTSSFFNDHVGYVNEPYAFYFKEGV